MSNPIKHHYIPQSILTRFCDIEGLLCTFNKQIGKRGKKRHPAGVCYEENLHTLIQDGEKFTEIESFYSQLEDKFLELLRMVDECLKKINRHGAAEGKRRSYQNIVFVPNVIFLANSEAVWFGGQCPE